MAEDRSAEVHQLLITRMKINSKSVCCRKLGKIEKEMLKMERCSLEHLTINTNIAKLDILVIFLLGRLP